MKSKIIKLANSKDIDKMQHATFHLCLYCLQKYPFSGFQYTKGKKHLDGCVSIIFEHLCKFNHMNTRDNKCLNGPRREKTCLRWVANNKGADQPAHMRSLISAFVIRLS